MEPEECINSCAISPRGFRLSSRFGKLHFSQGFNNMPSLPGCFYIHKPVISRYIVSYPLLFMLHVSRLLIDIIAHS